MLTASQEPPMLPRGVSGLSELPGRWWVGHTKSRFEKAFARDLQREGIGYFLPLVRKLRIVHGRKRRVRLPLFPSYVFFCGDEQSRWAAMRTNRLCQTLTVADQGQFVAQCSAIERALSNGAELDPHPGLTAGRRCRVTAGPFRGTEGTVVHRDARARIVLEITTVGLSASLEVDADLLEPIEPTASG